MDECSHICDTCKYYRKVVGQVRSRCTNNHHMLGVVIPFNGDFIIVDEDTIYFETTPDYGCVLWESKRVED